MLFFKKPRIIRRYKEPIYEQGYYSTPYDDSALLMDVQTLQTMSRTGPDGTDSLQELKVFCDEELLTEDDTKQQKADRLWFQNKWFACTSCRLSENTPLRHWTATFVQCLEQEEPPEEGMEV